MENIRCSPGSSDVSPMMTTPDLHPGRRTQDPPSERRNGVINANSSSSENTMQLKKMQGAVKTLLECIGEDPDREGLRETPERVSKALLFLTSGYHSQLHEVVKNALYDENHSEIVLLKNIRFSSLCEHHMAPFSGKLHIGYIPAGKVIGLSKLVRIAEIYARQLQVQERLTSEVATAVEKATGARGVVVVIEAAHGCMVSRGVQQSDVLTITKCALGTFLAEPSKMSEFFDVLKSCTPI